MSTREPPCILDAENHERETEILARAGRPGAVTVLTQMAGRGIGIRLEEPAGAGLFVLVLRPLATHRLERRLRECAGRGGEPGESAFFVSFDDPHMRLRGPATTLDDFQTDGPVLSRVIARGVAAKLTELSEARNKSVTAMLRWSAVREEQRAVLYALRADVLRDGLTRDQTDTIIGSAMRVLVLDARTGPQEVDRLSLALGKHYPCTISREVIEAGLAGNPSSKARAALLEAVIRDARAAATAREAEPGPDVAAELRRRVMLAVMDRLCCETARQGDVGGH